MVVNEDEWHFLSFSLSPATFYNKSEATILLDEYFFRQEFPMPKFPDNIIDPLIGDCPEYLRINGYNTTMRGQLGKIFKYFLGLITFYFLID
jgi:hypothetical protein